MANSIFLYLMIFGMKFYRGENVSLSRVLNWASGVMLKEANLVKKLFFVVLKVYCKMSYCISQFVIEMCIGEMCCQLWKNVCWFFLFFFSLDVQGVGGRWAVTCISSKLWEVFCPIMFFTIMYLTGLWYNILRTLRSDPKSTNFCTVFRNDAPNISYTLCKVLKNAQDFE